VSTTPSPEEGNTSSFQNIVFFLVSRILEDGKEVQNPNNPEEIMKSYQIVHV
jgi:hypothetical protein